MFYITSPHAECMRSQAHNSQGSSEYRFTHTGENSILKKLQKQGIKTNHV